MLITLARESNMPALALTDMGNLHGAWKFSRESLRVGIKPVIGCEVLIDEECYPSLPRKKGAPFHLTLLAKNKTGFSNLCNLLAEGERHAKATLPIITIQHLATYHDGLIALSGCLEGVIPQLIISQRIQPVIGVVTEMREILGDRNYYFEVHPPSTTAQAWVNSVLFDLGKQLSVPVVATADVHYPYPDDREAYQGLLTYADQSGTAAQPKGARDELVQHFLTPEEMLQNFKHNQEALQQTLAIAAQCEPDVIAKRPKLWWQEAKCSDELCYRQILDAARERSKQLGLDKLPATQSRLKEELAELGARGILDYLWLHLKLFTAITKDGGIIGSGGGLCAGSLVCYLLGLTPLNPLTYSLPFNSFFDNGERGFLVRQPSIQLGVCSKGFESALRWLNTFFANVDLVSPAVFARPKSLDLLQKVMTTHAQPPEILEPLTQFCTAYPEQYLTSALIVVDNFLYLLKASASLREFLSQAETLENLPLHVVPSSTAFFVVPKPELNDIPLLRAKNGKTITQWTLNDLKEKGHLGFEVVQATPLDIVRECLELVRQNGNSEPPITTLTNIPLDDPATYALLHEARTTGIPYMHSERVRWLLHAIQPQTLDELALALACASDDLWPDIQSRLEQQVELSDQSGIPEAIATILRPTWGLLLYQEQAIQVLDALTEIGYDAARERLRTLEKQPQEIYYFQEDLTRILGAKQIPEAPMAKILQRLLLWSSLYSRNRILTTSCLCYWLAYLKAHYPAPFLCALLRYYLTPHRPIPQFRLELITTLIAEAEGLGITVNGDAGKAKSAKLLDGRLLLES